VQTNNRLKAVLFDLDGLMINSERNSYYIWRDYLSDFGLEFTYEEYQKLIGQGSTFTAEYMQKRIGSSIPAQQIMDEHWDRLTEYIAEHVDPFPGLYDLIEELQKLGLLLGVASNSRKNYVEQALIGLKLLDTFQCVLSAEQVGRSKPAPDVYLQAANCLGVSAPLCLALEDSPPGMKSALAAGMRCVVVPNLDLNASNFDGAFARFDNLVQVHRNLDRILSLD
jgi:HAD superfamily hydrolase (TIGR01509 family)